MTPRDASSLADRLLPCPFCGHRPKIDDNGDDGVTIECKTFDCAAQSVEFFEWDREDSVRKWNTRSLARPEATAADKPRRGFSDPKFEFGYESEHDQSLKTAPGEAVAWRWRYRTQMGWNLCEGDPSSAVMQSPEFIIEPLYASPPVQVSVPGEAVAWHREGIHSYFVLEKDREYARDILDDLDDPDEGLTKIENAARWVRKIRVEVAREALNTSAPVQVAERETLESTKLMRDRFRELCIEHYDDFARAGICILHDLERLLK